MSLQVPTRKRSWREGTFLIPEFRRLPSAAIRFQACQRDVHDEVVQGLPVTGVRHRGPRLRRRLRFALLQKLDRMQIR